MIAMLANRSISLRKMLLVLFIAAAGCTGLGDRNGAATPEKKTSIAKPMLTDFDGRSIDLEQFKGRTIFLNFWATWCKPCIHEMPSIKSAQAGLSKTGIVFLFASNEDADEIKDFEKIYNYNFNYVKVRNLEELGMEGLPTTYIFNPRGELVFSETGYRKWNDSANIKMILKITEQK